MLIALCAPASARDDRAFGPHNLREARAANSSICIFCHTPHRSASESPGWSAGERPPMFDTFDALSAGGQVEVRENVSIACLSCHDGSQAPDVQVDFAALSDAPRRFAPTPPRPLREHPIGIVYGGFGEARGAFSADNLQRQDIAGSERWWLDLEAEPNGVRDKSDIIFYTRVRDGRARPFIECSTCHDPHANANRRFLRAPNAGSTLCYTCHTI